MAPIRRYLRITSSSVLEVRIYLENPALSSSWLLRSRDPVLPRVIEAVRPLVLPKLREENERDKSRGKLKAKKKGVKDTVVEGMRCSITCCFAARRAWNDCNEPIPGYTSRKLIIGKCEQTTLKYLYSSHQPQRDTPFLRKINASVILLNQRYNRIQTG